MTMFFNFKIVCMDSLLLMQRSKESDGIILEQRHKKCVLTDS